MLKKPQGGTKSQRAKEEALQYRIDGVSRRREALREQRRRLEEEAEHAEDNYFDVLAKVGAIHEDVFVEANRQDVRNSLVIKFF